MGAFVIIAKTIALLVQISGLSITPEMLGVGFWVLSDGPFGYAQDKLLDEILNFKY